MKKSFILALNNIKKSLGQYLSFAIILIIASTIFSSAIILKLNVSKAFDKKYKEFNTASSYITIPNELYSEDLLKEIKSIDCIKKAEIRDGIYAKVTVDFNGTEQEQDQIFYNMDNEHELNNLKIIEQTEETLENPIYLPYYIYINSDYNIKDKYEFELNGTKYSFNIKGYVEEMQYGNYSASVIGVYLNNESYNYLEKNNQNSQIKTISVLSDNGEKAYNEVSKILSKDNITVLNKNYDTQTKQSRLIITNLLVIILVAFSIIILLISLLVSKFKIANGIEEDLSNMGVLKASGYTNKQIIFSVMFPYIAIGIIGTLIGIGLSYLLIPVLSSVITMQSGFTWKQGFDLISFIITLFIIIILIILFTYNAAKKIKKLSPVNAIRGINDIKKETKNHFEIEKTRGNIQLILTLKNFINTLKQNFLLGIVLFFITILASFSSILFYNININPMNFVNTLVEEHPSVILYTSKDIKKEILDMNEVEKAIYYDENGSAIIGENSYKVFISETFENLANDLCFEGRNPQNHDEIAIGNNIADKYNLSINDTIKIKKDVKEYTYKIVGLVQSVNNSGEVIELTLDGYKILDEVYEPNSLYVYLDNENNCQNFIDKVENQFSNEITSTVNYAESMNSVLEMYVGIIKIVCIVMVILTISIIYLILYLIISSIIVNKKQELGILKSVGYINRQLMLQISGSLMPSTIISTVLGMICSKVFLGNMFISLFKVVGAYKISFEYPMLILALISIALIISTFTISAILARKIKKIEVYKLIKE